jgi:hypothetical protein
MSDTQGEIEIEKVVPSKFEQLVTKLGIEQADWVTSKPLKRFAKKFKYTHYVPEYLLTEWGMQVYF